MSNQEWLESLSELDKLLHGRDYCEYSSLEQCCKYDNCEEHRLAWLQAEHKERCF